MQLRSHFRALQRIYVKNSRRGSFRDELTSILQFLDHDEPNRELRCIVVGVAFAGPIICMNTQALKSFLGRCKSSINGCFQQLGYAAVKHKVQARDCVVSVLPELEGDRPHLRQWTVRAAMRGAEVCFISALPTPRLPKIPPEDLLDGELPRKTDPEAQKQPRMAPQYPNQPFASLSVEETFSTPVQIWNPPWASAIAQPIEIEWPPNVNEW
jgi:hypothetical protein